MYAATWKPAAYKAPNPLYIGQAAAEPPHINGVLGLPMTTDGLVLMGLGAAAGLVGVYWAKKKTKVVGKKLSPFWNFVFGTGGIGTVLAVVGAVPLVALGALELGGGILINNKLKEMNQALVAPK